MKDHKKRRKLLLTSLFLIGCFAVGLIGGTLAYYQKDQTLENPFTVGKAQVSLNEEFNPLSSFLPGETVDKKAHFENRGTADLYLRVFNPLDPSIAKWDPEADDEGQPLNVNAVEITWGKTWPEPPAVESQDWIRIGDYYYYKKILKAGENTDKIIEALTLSPEVSNDRHGPDYSNKTFCLDLKGQAVSIQEGIAEEEWNVKPTVNEATGVITWEAVSSTQ